VQSPLHPIVRPATLADVPALVRLFRMPDANERDRAAPPGDLAPYVEAWHAIERDPNNVLVVAEHGQAVAGTLQLTVIPYLGHRGGRVAQIENVFVDEHLRGREVGDALVRWAIGQACQRGCFRIQLTSNKARVRAHCFYERCGFVATHDGFKLSLEGSVAP
jgi:GNAT superfamily N-acetyltransferase